MLGLTSKTVRIGSFEYEFTLLPVEVGHPLRWELIGLLGEPLVQTLASVVAGKIKSVGDVNVEQALSGLSAVFARLDPRFILRLQQTFVNVTRYRGPGGDWTSLSQTWQLQFAGKYHELDQLTWAQLRFNYLSFLDDSTVWQALARAAQRALSDAQSRGTSQPIGSSGASSVATGSA